MSRYKFGNGATWHGNAATNERAQIMSPLGVAGIAAADDGGHESFRAAIKLITHFAVWARHIYFPTTTHVHTFSE